MARPENLGGKPALYSIEQIKNRIEQAERQQATGDEGRTEIDGLPAAVLIGLINHDDGPTILLTKRTDHLRDHAGQICFPGGRIEKYDPSVEAAALREAEEEVGLDPAKVEIIGRLRPYDTSTGFRVHPVVGWIDPPLDLELDSFEVAEAFELPLNFVLDPENHRQQTHQRSQGRPSYYVLPFQGRFIWGATAGMLVIFANLLLERS